MLSACSKDDRLAPKRDYFECKINGKPFETVGKGFCTAENVGYYPNGSVNIDPGFYYMDGQNCDNGAMIGIKFQALNPSKKVYSALSDSVFPYYSPPFTHRYNIDSVLSGKVWFTTLEPQQYDKNGNRISTGNVEGLFNFTVVDTAGNQYKVTEGRFGFFNFQ